MIKLKTPAYKKWEIIKKSLYASLVDCNKATASTTADKLYEFANRTANIKANLTQYKGDADLIAYAQGETEDDLIPDLQAIFASFDIILAAIQAIDKSLSLTMDANGRQVWQVTDTTTIVEAVASFQAVVSFE